MEENMEKRIIYQVSTLQALALGYSRAVISAAELLEQGDTGLGTFENVDGEMIVLDGHCYRAADDGSVIEIPLETGVPFASVTRLNGDRRFAFGEVTDIDRLKSLLDIKIEEVFGLNSMHIARIDGRFRTVRARSEAPYRSHHIALKEILAKTQKDFTFTDVSGTMVCVYYPDYMDGINAPGWHLHFVSDDRRQGGHVFELDMERGEVQIDRISSIEIRLPSEPAFDTYELKNASQDEIREVEQGKG